MKEQFGNGIPQSRSEHLKQQQKEIAEKKANKPEEGQFITDKERVEVAKGLNVPEMLAVIRKRYKGLMRKPKSRKY